jgi:glucose/arabinose dehydrogenase
VLLEIDQPAGNHNGGMVAFGPDGYLWISTGDGGGANDQFDQGQRPDTLLGTMLRIDVDGDPYAVPTANPFADGGEGAAEVWAYGLRNPWRFSFDGDRLYIADVGQNEIEEVDVVEVEQREALNFGWPIMEGTNCFRSSSCSSDGLVLPVVEYPHGEGCSVTGGYVYRGTAIPELVGHYFYGDYCSGWVRSFLVADDGSVGEEREWLPRGTLAGLTSFGVDATGELYAMTTNGTIWRIVRSDTSP